LIIIPAEGGLMRPPGAPIRRVRRSGSAFRPEASRARRRKPASVGTTLRKVTIFPYFEIRSGVLSCLLVQPESANDDPLQDGRRPEPVPPLPKPAPQGLTDAVGGHQRGTGTTH